MVRITRSFQMAPRAGKRGKKQLSIVFDEVFSTKQGVWNFECIEKFQTTMRLEWATLCREPML